MNELTYSVFCIDLRNFNSAQDFDLFLKQVGLPINAKNWYEVYLGNWIKGVRVNRIWFDKVTLSLVAYETDSEQMIYPSFADYLNKLQPIDTSFKFGKVEFATGENGITIDSVLQKILESGMNSLTIEELEFLEKNSGLI